jgi:protein arginine kinase activator
MVTCEECKNNPVDVILTMVINGLAITKHLCSDCAKKYNPNEISNVLAAILASMAAKESTPDIICPSCRMTFAEYKTSGRLGCAKCYSAFRVQLQPILLRIHGRVHHAGRRPPETMETRSDRQRIDDLRKRLCDAVNDEDYETAALLRDEIKSVTLAAMKEDE